jgi:hypothetical protein
MAVDGEPDQEFASFMRKGMLYFADQKLKWNDASADLIF